MFADGPIGMFPGPKGCTNEILCPDDAELLGLLSSVAEDFARAAEEACSLFQFAFSTRAGVDCVGHAVRVATEADAEAEVLPIHGIGAHDHVHQSAMLNKLLGIPPTHLLLVEGFGWCAAPRSTARRG